MTDEETPNEGDPDPPPTYIIFLLVFFFFITGLLGFLICHLLKTKGYRCQLEEDEEDCEDKLGTDKDDESEDSQDTVEQILKCIIENEANMEAFKDMLVVQNVCERHDPRFHHKDSAGGLPFHHHTVHLGGEISSCVHCMQGHILKTRRRSRLIKSKARPAEQTVFSVGRFRVTHMDKSLQGLTNLPTSKPGNASNDTTLSDGRTGLKDTSNKHSEEYNIRNMFKDTGATNGKVLNIGKRKKSVTLLGFYKAGNPVETKGGQEVFEEDKEGSTTADQLSISLDEGLSSVPLSPTDETALDEKSKIGSVSKLEETSLENKMADEATLCVKSQDKLSTNTTEIVPNSSNDCSRFSVVRTTEETVIPPAAAADYSGDDTTKHEDVKTGQVSQESTDSKQI